MRFAAYIPCRSP